MASAGDFSLLPLEGLHVGRYTYLTPTLKACAHKEQTEGVLSMWECLCSLCVLPLHATPGSSSAGYLSRLPGTSVEHRPFSPRHKAEQRADPPLGQRTWGSSLPQLLELFAKRQKPKTSFSFLLTLRVWLTGMGWGPGIQIIDKLPVESTDR